MYSDHFEGVHPITGISYVVLVPATPGPGGVWPVHWKTYSAHPAADVDPIQTDDTYTFVSPKKRAAWWRVVRKEIIWMRLLPEAVEIMPNRNWLDLTDDVATKEGNAA